MLDIRKFWPVPVYGLLMFLNTDVLIPWGIWRGYSRDILLTFIPPLATVELLYSFWFWGWVVDRVAELEKIKEMRQKLGHRGVFDWIIDRLLQGQRSAKDPKNRYGRWIHSYGIGIVWVLGLNPIPSLPTRGPCGILLGVFQRRREFYHLSMANFIHVLFMVWWWSWLLGR